MSALIKNGTTLLLLTAVVGLASSVAAQVVEAARTTLEEQWAGLGNQQWRLDPSEVAALPDGWRGMGLVTAHDGLQDGVYELSGEYEIAVHTAKAAKTP